MTTYMIKDKKSGVYFQNGDDTATFKCVAKEDGLRTDDRMLAGGFKNKAKRICNGNGKITDWCVVVVASA